MSPILGEHLLSSMSFFGLCGLPAGSLLSLGMEATRQGWYLTTAQRHRLGPSPRSRTETQPPESSILERMLGRNLCLPDGPSACSTMTLKASTGAPLGHACPFSLLGFTLNGHKLIWLQDLPDTGWLKCDHARGSPAFSL